eukprot:CAMPEP_0196655898 /NCGR_PEP_ID=MMETSP1086-20130531/10238_1 /TAXON_ID=77921 /ORGANISM="Cyanoptyche  gloeocystis , Strain SAG4.97" /LENGTH=429 /DNA_ID=CAMNT_0041988429 /DNA_START=247 /DNA_END=1536 /DNA_ORIENTATION=+
MPKLQTKVEGRGNGIKTVIPNMIDVARSLHRPPSYPTKFFGYEVGAQSKWDEKAMVAVVNGCHDTSKLAELLTGFIEKFVLCPVCKLPEADLEIDKKENIYLNCKACGSTNMVDMRHKLVKFIQNNPPENAGKKTTARKKNSAAPQEAGKKEDDDGAESSGSAKDKKSKKDRDKKKEDGDDKKKKKKDKKQQSDDDDDDDDWAIDTSAEAVEARRKAEMDTLTSKASQMFLQVETTEASLSKPSTPRDPSTDSPRVSNGVSKEKDSKKDEGHKTKEGSKKTPADLTLEDIRNSVETNSATKAFAFLQKSMPDDKQRLKKTCEALFFGVSTGKDFQALVKKHLGLLQKLVPKELQLEFLHVLESLIASASIQKSTANILKMVYDDNLVEEEVFLEWDKAEAKDRNAEVREKAQPFLTWLRTADDDSEEED